MNKELTTFTNLHALYEVKAYRRLLKEFRKLIRNIDLTFVNPDTIEAVLKLNINTESMAKVMEKLYLDIGLQYGRLVVKSLPEPPTQIKALSPKYALFSETFRRYIVMYFQTQGGSAITSLVDTMIDEVMKVFVKAQQEFLTMNEIIKEVTKTINSPTFYRWQAARIARTETTFAMNSAKEKAFDGSGYPYEKIWFTRMDGKQRDTHAYMNRKKVDANEKFLVGDSYLSFPGDRNGSAKEVINCRCTFGYLAKTDENGRIDFSDL